MDLVLLWGWTSNDASDKRLLDLTPKGWNVYTVPLFHLISDGNLNKFEHKILELIEKKNLKKPILAGHSLGAALAVKFAARYSSQIEQLILVDSEGVPTGDSVYGLFKKVVRSHLQEKGQVERDHLKTLLQLLSHPKYTAHLIKMALTIDVQEEATTLTVPTQILWGEQDLVIPLEQGKRLHQLIKSSDLKVFKGMDHNWILHSPELFWQEISLP